MHFLTGFTANCSTIQLHTVPTVGCGRAGVFSCVRLKSLQSLTAETPSSKISNAWHFHESARERAGEGIRYKYKVHFSKSSARIVRESIFKPSKCVTLGSSVNETHARSRTPPSVRYAIVLCCMHYNPTWRPACFASSLRPILLISNSWTQD